MRATALVTIAGIVLLSATACRKPPEEAKAVPLRELPPPVTAPVVAPPLPPQPPAQVERLAVPGDLDASIVRASATRPPLTVFVPGMCSNGYAYLLGFPEAARKQGGIVAVEGDQPCGGAVGFHTFSWDAAKLDARITKALAAAGVDAIPDAGITLVGYSQGAALGEQLAARFPQKYARVVLIGAPTDPSPASFAKSRGVVTMSCSRDVPARMREASQRVAKSGVASTYLEMPGCTHGNLAEGEQVFDDAFEFLRSR